MARRDTSFYYAFLILPRDQRRAITAVWDFCRVVDDAVDEKAGAADRAAARGDAADELAKWRREVAAIFEGRPPETDVAKALAEHVAAFRLSREPFDAVIDGVAMDLDDRRFATFNDLREYCLRVASAVGLICIQIFRATDAKARDYAVNLGVALQLTNILRDVGSDLAIGRVYLPIEDLDRYGVTEADLRAGVVSDAVRSLLAFEADRAHEHYRLAAIAMPRADSRKLVAARIMGAIYFDLLLRIRRSGFAVFGGPIRAPRWRKAIIAGRMWIWSMLGLSMIRRVSRRAAR